MNKTSLFGQDVLCKGAILGALMLVSTIIEQTATLYGATIPWLSTASIEGLVVIILYIYLLCRFTKSYATKVLDSREVKYFSYGEGLSYVVTCAVLAGVIVGFGDYIFRHFVVGYDEYINRTLVLMQNVLASAEIPSSMAGIYEQSIAQMREQSEPSLIATIVSKISNYLFGGLIVGLFVAAKTKRAPELFDETKNE